MAVSLFDNHGRIINYARIAVTDRCNLRCFYCMPEEGIQYMPKQELLQFEELERLTKILTELGITKLRITGGEPFVRKDIMKFIESIHALPHLEEIHITTNGTHSADIIPELKRLGIKSVNLSLDTLNAARFFEITRRDLFSEVYHTLESLIIHDIPTKINAVVMANKNIDDLIPLCELTKNTPVSVRFIEEMPFNGTGSHYEQLYWNHVNILAYLKNEYPNLYKMEDPKYATSSNYKIPGYLGSIGIIAAYSRTFCGTCNRIRITPQGTLKTCLYDHGVFNLRDLMRNEATDEQIKEALLDSFSNRAKDGWEAEKNRFDFFPATESMSTIGG
ncbi:MAG: GTP 3',8-cyclase MoaA [Bacteroidetes bacterium]|nr:GTP 3',8-cyclase MoaA [Bacteroidota bacterium]